MSLDIRVQFSPFTPRVDARAVALTVNGGDVNEHTLDILRGIAKNCYNETALREDRIGLKSYRSFFLSTKRKRKVHCACFVAIALQSTKSLTMLNEVMIADSQ